MYIYDTISRSVENNDLLQKLEVAAATVAKRLRVVDFNALELSNYTKKYIQSHLINTNSVLQIYTYLLYLVLKSRDLLNLKNSVFVDYGGGTGIMSLLAKEMGFGTVLYVDIYDVSCNDAKLIGFNVGECADKYICGGVDELNSYVATAKICVDVVASYDVIEHIYDLNHFYAKLNMLTNNRSSIVSASSANMYNPMIRKKRMAVQQKVEFQSRKHEWGHKERDSLQSYYELRKEIVSNFAPQLPQDVVASIAKNTRGLHKGDIEECVRKYVELGDFAYRPFHPTNTCDPLTGNWNERLMDIQFIEEIVKTNGFNISILSGYYGYSDGNIWRNLKILINYFIRLLGKKGVYFAPYYVALAEK